jgi:hypothetical protein
MNKSLLTFTHCRVTEYSIQNEMCGAGKAKRAERSGLPVMLSGSETSHFMKHSP